MGLRTLPIKIDYNDYRDFIFSYCKFCQYQTMVELGVYLGDTTIRLCEAAQITGGKVFGYDRFEPVGEALSWNDPRFGKEGIENMLSSSGYKPATFKITKIDTKNYEFVEILKTDTVGKIDFAFIDADHSYNGIMNDFLKVYPLLIEDGSIIFHDTYNHNGCRKFMLDLYQDLNDGTFDIINLPFGSGESRCGLSILSKRSFPLYSENLVGCYTGEIPQISKAEVYEAEKTWYSNQIKKKKL
jgi:hypothetical protein